MLQLVFPECKTKLEDKNTSEGIIKIDNADIDMMSDAQAQPTAQPLKPTARSVETLTNQMVFNIIGEVTRRNSAELLEGVTSNQQNMQESSASSVPSVAK